MLSKCTREITYALFMVACFVLGVIGLVSAIGSKNLPMVAVCGFLLLGSGPFAYERLFPIGGRVLYRALVVVAIPGTTSIEVRTSHAYTRGRLFVIFDKTKSFYNGTVTIKERGLNLAVKKLPAIDQFQSKRFRMYNRALVRDSDRLYIDVKCQDSQVGALMVELDLTHNVTDPKLRSHLQVVDSPEFEIVLKGR